jgi:hypothetical protein
VGHFRFANYPYLSVNIVPFSYIGDFLYTTTGNTYLEGKQRFLASAAEEFERRHCITISRNTTLLIDDDVRNINIALDKGVRAVWLNPDHPQT